MTFEEWAKSIDLDPMLVLVAHAIWDAAQQALTTADPVTLSEDTVRQIEESARQAEREKYAELLEALEVMLECSEMNGYPGKHVVVAEQKARAAIAKAKGEKE